MLALRIREEPWLAPPPLGTEGGLPVCCRRLLLDPELEPSCTHRTRYTAVQLLWLNGVASVLSARRSAKSITCSPWLRHQYPSGSEPKAGGAGATRNRMCCIGAETGGTGGTTSNRMEGHLIPMRLDRCQSPVRRSGAAMQVIRHPDVYRSLGHLKQRPRRALYPIKQRQRIHRTVRKRSTQ